MFSEEDLLGIKERAGNNTLVLDLVGQLLAERERSDTLYTALKNSMELVRSGPYLPQPSDKYLCRLPEAIELYKQRVDKVVIQEGQMIYARGCASKKELVNEIDSVLGKVPEPDTRLPLPLILTYADWTRTFTSVEELETFKAGVTFAKYDPPPSKEIPK